MTRLTLLLALAASLTACSAFLEYQGRSFALRVVSGCEVWALAIDVHVLEGIDPGLLHPAVPGYLEILRMTVARRYFAPAEVDEYLACPPAERTWAFFNGWTRKEAFIKAIGDGLTCPLDSFRVSLRPGLPARLLEIYTDPGEAANWQLADLAPGPGYAGAVMVAGQGLQLDRLSFDHRIHGRDR